MFWFWLVVAIILVLFYKINPNLDYLEMSNGRYDVILWYTPFWRKDNERDYITIF
jgi:hypothetical protein